MSLIGLWPYQNARIGLGLRLCIYFMGFCFAIPQVIAVVKYCDNMTILLEGSITFIFFATITMKLLFSRFNLTKVRPIFFLNVRTTHAYMRHNAATDG